MNKEEFSKIVDENVVRIDVKNDGYSTVTLVERMFDPNKITKEDFISNLREDMSAADTRYKTICLAYIDYKQPEVLATAIERETKRAETYAVNKWKRQTNRDKYISKRIDDVKAAENSIYIANRERISRNGLSFADFVPNHRENSIPIVCCVETDNLTNAALGRCYDATMERNVYWKNAIGWKIEYESSRNSYYNAFRPHITLILNEDHKDDMKKDSEMLANAISEFYKDTKYFGD